MCDHQPHNIKNILFRLKVLCLNSNIKYYKINEIIVIQWILKLFRVFGLIFATVTWYMVSSDPAIKIILTCIILCQYLSQ